MPVTITFPEVSLPDTFPILTAVNRPWEQEELAALGERLGGVALEPAGLWHIGRNDHSLIEVYAASRSFRVEALAGSETDGASERGIGEVKATELATDFLAPYRCEGAEFVRRAVSESIVVMSEGEHREPKRLVTGTSVSFSIMRDGVGFVGPGAKAQVTVGTDGAVRGAYRMWRDVTQVGECRALTVDEVAGSLGGSPIFEKLTDDTARVEISSARVGLFALPPTEVQQLFYPAIELRGSVTTRAATVGFCTYVAAADPRALTKASRVRGRRQPPPPELVA